MMSRCIATEHLKCFGWFFYLEQGSYKAKFCPFKAVKIYFYLGILFSNPVISYVMLPHNRF